MIRAATSATAGSSAATLPWLSRSNGTLCAILLAAAVIRFLAAAGDLALDEIWSLDFVRNHLHHFLGVFSFRHDNNHLLNTMILALLGADLPGLWYRIPAVIASIASVWLAGLIAARRHGKVGTIIASLVTGGSYLMILYGSEARGYAYAVLFAYLAWWSLVRLVENGHRIDAVVFTCSSCLGLLAHLTFVYCYAGFCLFTLWKFIQRPRWDLVLVHLPPLVVVAVLFLWFVPGMSIGGGPETSTLAAISTTVSMVGGGPLSGDVALVVGIVLVLLLVYGLAVQWQTDAAATMCLSITIFMVPAAALALTGHSIIYPRYFLIPIVFALLVISDTLAHWWRCGGSHRPFVLLMLVAVGIGNGLWTWSLLDHGRGNYSATIRWMAHNSDRTLSTIASDHDFRNGMVIDYYLKRLWSVDPPLRYISHAEFPPQGTDWLIRHSFEGDPPMNSLQIDPFGNRYQLERTDQNRSVTGWNWWIYRRQPR